MRKKLKLLLVAATLALTIGIISLGGGVVSAPAKAAGSGTLAGFTSSGASVYIATDGTDAKQMRFQIDLTADKAAYAGEGKPPEWFIYRSTCITQKALPNSPRTRLTP